LLARYRKRKRCRPCRRVEDMADTEICINNKPVTFRIGFCEFWQFLINKKTPQAGGVFFIEEVRITLVF